MKIKVLKVIILMLISTFVLSAAVLPCFAYGAERDPFNAVISDDWLLSSLHWDVTLAIDGESQHGDSYDDHYVNFKFDPVFPTVGLSDVLNSSTSDNTSSMFYMPIAGYNDTLTFDLRTTFDYTDHIGFVDVVYDWSLFSNEISFYATDVQFQARQFYYTYQPDIVTEYDSYSPFQFYFDGASSVTTQVYYHELGNDVDLLTVSFTDDEYGESQLFPDLFGYSEDQSFTIFIDRVVVIPEYYAFSDILDFQYGYVPAFSVFSRSADLNSHATPPSDAVFADYTSWIGLAVSGFLEFQIFPGFSFGALLMVIISFSTVMWFLKLFAGG